MILRLLFACSLCTVCAFAKRIQTNNILFQEAPDWLTEGQVEQATNTVQNFLQWDLHRIKAFYHQNQNEFESLHHAGRSIKAFFRPSDSTLHLGPEVNAQNFVPIFSHEIVHAVFFQKYKGAIPPWLEEGLANYLGKTGPVDYRWLASQPPVDITTLAHPTKDSSGLKYHYQASQAAAEMIVAQCSLDDLLQLSVGRKLVTYLSTYCEIPDVNVAFKKWVAKKAGEKSGERAVAKKTRWWEQRKKSP